MLDKTAMEPKNELIGVSVYEASGYFFLRLHLRGPVLDRLGNPKKLAIRGQPANGFIIEPDKKGMTLRPQVGGLNYLVKALSNFELSARHRRTIYVRPEFSKTNSTLRLPSLPPAWINADEEFINEERIDTRNGAAPTTPLPKATPPMVYQIPENVGTKALQVELAQTIVRAREIIAEMEKRTGMKLILDRHLRLVVAL